MSAADGSNKPYVHRGRTGDPLCAARRMLHTGTGLLTDRQHERLNARFTDGDHVEGEATWGVYQQMISAYRNLDRTTGNAAMTA